LDHFLRREPVRPLFHAADALGAGPGEAVAADADAITDRFAVAAPEIEVSVGGIDNDRAGGLVGAEVHDLTVKTLRQLFGRSLFRLIFRRQGGNDIRAGARRRGAAVS